MKKFRTFILGLTAIATTVALAPKPANALQSWGHQFGNLYGPYSISGGKQACQQQFDNLPTRNVVVYSGNPYYGYATSARKFAWDNYDITNKRNNVWWNGNACIANN